MKPLTLIVVAHSGWAINRQQNCPHRGRVGGAGVPLVGVDPDTGSVSLVREYVSHYRGGIQDVVCISKNGVLHTALGLHVHYLHISKNEHYCTHMPINSYFCVYKHFLTTSCVAMSLSDNIVCATRVNLCVGVADEQ